MRKSVALLLGVLVPLLGLAGAGNAQSTVQVQGTIQAVDCQSQTVVLATPNSTNTIAVAPYTAVAVDSQAVSLCDLQQYIGSPATVWLVANGNEFVATRIDATAQGVTAPVVTAAPVQTAIDPLPIVGVVLGTIAVAGLIYLLVRDNDRYYRYPYYGDYYGYYYHPEYRPYLGWYPAVCPILFAPAPLTGFVLGVTVVDGFDYLLVRDRDGRFARYPYFGPYRDRYYRPEYRAYTGPYAGAYRSAPVRYGEWRNNAPLSGPRQQPYQRSQPYNGRPNYNNYNRGPAQYQQPQRPNYHYNNNYNRGPAQYQQPQWNGRPNYTPVPQRPNTNYNNYNRGPAQYQQPQRPNYNYNNNYNRGPAQYQQPQWNGRPNYTPVPQRPNTNYNNYNRGPVQYQQPQRPNYNYNNYNRGPAQYQRPSYNNNQGGYNRGGGSSGGRGQGGRQTCNSRDGSCNNR
jgi:hypothetical protein